VPPTPALPADCILLHIGPHKTGTTALQAALASRREAMAEHGVLYPGTQGAHHLEARVLGRQPAGWQHDNERLPGDEVWTDLVREATSAPGRVVISSEFFAQWGAPMRARIIESLGGERLHVLIAARNPGSIAVSTWQQVLRDGKAGELDTWLEERFRRDRPTRTTEGFWSWADAATLAEEWSPLVGPDHLHVVVIDEQDKALLPGTVEQLLGLPPELLPRRIPTAHNRSLTAVEAELLRQVLDRTLGQVSWEDFSRLVRSGFTRRLLNERVPPPDEARATLPDWAAEQAAAEAESIESRLRSLGVHVIGDLDNLRRLPPHGEQPRVTQIPVDAAAEAAAGVITAAVRSLERARADARRAARRREKPRKQRPAAPMLPSQRPVEEVPTRELATILGDRVRAGVRRRLTGRWHRGR
jgi:hypothetical protein